MLAKVRAGLAAQLDGRLVDELLAAHAEAKRNFYLGGLRLNAVEGGRFCEAGFRLLQQAAGIRITPLSQTLDTTRVIQHLAALPNGSKPDSIRLHIPRALRVVYDIRSNRDAVHLADNIDPNLQDATLVVGIIDWVLAEFVRLYHNVPADEAQRIVQSLVTRAVPAVEDFDGFLKVLNPGLPASDHCLLLLYQRGPVGASYDELETWARPEMRTNLRKTLHRLVHEKAYIHQDGHTYKITRPGQTEVERRNLVSVDE